MRIIPPNKRIKPTNFPLPLQISRLFKAVGLKEHVEMDNDVNSLPPIIYPYHIEPKVRNFSTSFLFHENLAVSIAAWPMGDPIDAFISVGGRADQKNHPLSNLFNYVFYHFDIVQEVAVNEMKYLAPLGDKISRVMTIYPGTPEYYEVWEPYHDKCLHLAAKSLENAHIHSAAITDFIFRIYELMLIHDNNPDLVLESLANRASKLGGERLILAECALNRYTLPKTGKGSWLTDSKDMLNILAVVGDEVTANEEDTLSFRAEGLASTLFDKLLSPYAPKLDSSGIEIVNKMMDERAGELAVLRKKLSMKHTLL